MSEQKMPEPCEFLQAYEDAYAAGIERGRQQGLAEASRLERERLEALRAAVEGLLVGVSQDGTEVYYIHTSAVLAARTLLEQTE